MKAQLYCITCKINNWKYWGMVYKKNKTYLDRFEEHMIGKGGKHLYKGVLKYGRDSFSVKLIMTSSVNKIRNLEILKTKNTQFKQNKGWNGNVGKAIYNNRETILNNIQKRKLKQKEVSLKAANTLRAKSQKEKALIQLKRKKTINKKTKKEIYEWRQAIVRSWKGKTKENCLKLKKQSETMKKKWKTPTQEMLLGKIKESNTKTGRTKFNHEGIKKQSEKMKGRMAGKNNPSFKGWWVTPFGKFETLYLAGKSVGYTNPENVRKLCTKNIKIDKRIINNTVLTEQYKNKKSHDVGFGFIPKN